MAAFKGGELPACATAPSPSFPTDMRACNLTGRLPLPRAGNMNSEGSHGNLEITGETATAITAGFEPCMFLLLALPARPKQLAPPRKDS